ncbi:MAG TPA: tRNA (adenosine(37)-N6)-threonylcarbamoyltransferase complex transferase subunit TsaD, partial [Caldithrix sp.]|nr:tRNA (adenosine(37)-N6)-threonylcarbamoyltransferase complex transferase subunit TsaD [Caldithrix sp.]
PEVDKLAQTGDPEYVQFPRAMLNRDDFDFSYSGLKTAVLNFLQEKPEQEIQQHLADICASFQQAATEVLVKKTLRATRTYQVRNIVIAGGVAANSLLRKWLKAEAQRFHIAVHSPPFEFCTDNAAMIARAGYERLRRNLQSSLDLNAYPALRLGKAEQGNL